ncbi:MAG: autotransporter domain-containing protein [Phycisphaerae bacterium]|nr:autotransporter domain-containing protein [Phycisphaerae bacterium]
MAVGNGSPVRTDERWGLWGRGYGLFGDRKTEMGAPGYSYNVYGGSAGLDYQFTPRFLALLISAASNCWA